MLRSTAFASLIALQLMAAAGTAQVGTGSGPASSRAGVEPDSLSISRPPNVLVILCDQLNVRMLGHEGNGFGGVSTSLTPSLDQLALEGVRFANASCTTAVCQPARYSILTGRWPHHHGVRRNKIWEPRGETTFPELARVGGYHTASIGKHHLAWAKQPEPDRDDHGFDTILDLGDYAAYCAANGESEYDAPANIIAMPGLGTSLDPTGFTTNSNAFHPSGYWADEVIRFLEQRAAPGGDGRPFVCWYSMYGPHVPILPSGVPPDDWAHRYHPYEQLGLAPNLSKVSTSGRLSSLQSSFAYLTDDQHGEILSYYYGLISQIDFNIGRVLQRLDDLGLADDTLVVFTTDHGEMASEMSCWTKGAGAYDALTRVPLIVRFPGMLPAGQVLTAPASTLDIFPTLLEITGVPVPDAVRAAVDGASLTEWMESGTPPSDWRQETFHEQGNGLGQREFMVRTPTAKYVLDELYGVEEFYDLAADPFEITNLIDDPSPPIQAQIADLAARFQTWWNGGVGQAPFYGNIGDASAVPFPVIAPVPSAGAVGVPRDVDPAWQPCPGASVQRAWFGTNPDALSLATTLQYMECSFNPGTLLPATTYFWRIESINPNGATLGLVWSFTTESGGSGGPPLATAPSPAHHAEGLPLWSALDWTVGPGTTAQDVHFGPAGGLQLVAAGLDGATTTWDPGALSAGVTYEWRVDGADAAGTTTGDVWTFTTSPAGLPQRALAVFPQHLARDVPAGAVLRWLRGPGAASHDVHFGTSFPLPLLASQVPTTWNPGPLTSGQVYFWRVDEVNALGTTTGWTWRFVAE